jgi:hypothetical protein
MSTNEEDKIDKLTALVEKMNRGLYGDEINKQPGLMQKHFEVSAKVDMLDDHRKKAIWWGSGLMIGIQAVWFMIKEYFSK